METLKDKLELLRIRMILAKWKIEEKFEELLRDDRGMGTVEIILIIVVLIGLVVIFKSKLTKVVNDIFQKITDGAGGF